MRIASKCYSQRSKGWSAEILTPSQSFPCPRRPPLQRLTDAEKQRLLSGERIQKQTRTGRVGSGLVVVDVEAEVATVLAVLSDVDRCVF